MLTGTTLALILISGISMLSLRPVKFGLLSLIPNLVPAGVAFGVWALFVGQVGLAVSVVAAMTLGIAVDDTIHFLSNIYKLEENEVWTQPTLFVTLSTPLVLLCSSLPLF